MITIVTIFLLAEAVLAVALLTVLACKVAGYIYACLEDYRG